MTDIVDAISALVDEQLAAGPVDDYNADRYDKCPHCGRHWHGLPVTERIADMYAVRRFDESYSVAGDDSRVLCRGSDFIGPMPDERRYETVQWDLPADPFDAPDWATLQPNYLAPVPPQLRWWRLPRVPVEALCATTEGVTLTFGEHAQTWDDAHCRVLPIDDTEGFPVGLGLDVLVDVAPDIGGTWEPLTAPGSTRHPDDGEPPPTQPTLLDTRIDTVTWFGPTPEGGRISVVMPGGQVFTDTYQGDGQGRINAALEVTWQYVDEATRTIMGLTGDTDGRTA